MAILKFRCILCGHTTEKYYSKPVAVYCERCATVCELMPSIPGYRRDHTVKEEV